MAVAESVELVLPLHQLFDSPPTLEALFILDTSVELAMQQGFATATLAPLGSVAFASCPVQRDAGVARVVVGVAGTSYTFDVAAAVPATCTTIRAATTRITLLLRGVGWRGFRRDVAALARRAADAACDACPAVKPGIVHELARRVATAACDRTSSPEAAVFTAAITGPPCVGKTRMLNALADALWAATADDASGGPELECRYINVLGLLATHRDATAPAAALRAAVQEVLTGGAWQCGGASCLLVIDNVGLLAQPADRISDASLPLQLRLLAAEIAATATRARATARAASPDARRGVAILLGCGVSVAELPAVLRTPAWLDAEFAVPLAGVDERAALIRQLNVVSGDAQSVEAAVAATKGMVPPAITTLLDSGPLPSAQLGHGPTSATTLSDLVGVDDAVQLLRTVVVKPLTASASLAALGLSVPKGAIVTGAAGSGKTALLAALAGELEQSATTTVDVGGKTLTQRRLHTMLVDSHSLIEKEVGASERNVAALFARARAASPCVVFIDGLDAIAPPRNRTQHETHSASDRVLSTLLAEMDGIVDRSNATVVVIATAPAPESLDAAIRRAGRLDVHVTLPNPSAEAIETLLTRRLAPLLTSDAARDALRRTAQSLRLRSCTFADAAGVCRDVAAAAVAAGADAESALVAELRQATVW